MKSRLDVFSMVCTIVGAVFALMLTLVNVPVLDTFIAMAHGAFGNLSNVQNTIARSIPLMLCAFAVAIPARAGYFNIGGEGQFLMGAVGGTFVALSLNTDNAFLMLTGVMTGACLFAVGYALIPAALKLFINVNEVLVALMLNYLAANIIKYLLHGPWKDTSALGWPYSQRFSEAAILPYLNGTNIHIGLMVAIVFVFLMVYVLRTTKVGFIMRVIETNSVLAKLIGLSVRNWVFGAVTLGAVFAAIAGFGEVSVVQGRLRPDLALGYGYVGFLLSWLVAHNLVAIVPMALVFGALYSGGDALQLSAGLPAASVEAIIGLIIFSTLFADWAIQRMKKFSGYETNKSVGE